MTDEIFAKAGLPKNANETHWSRTREKLAANMAALGGGPQYVSKRGGSGFSWSRRTRSFAS